MSCFNVFIERVIATPIDSNEPATKRRVCLASQLIDSAIVQTCLQNSDSFFISCLIRCVGDGCVTKGERKFDFSMRRELNMP